MELLFVLISGAITYLVANTFNKGKEKTLFVEFAEYLVETGVNVFLMWLVFRAKGIAEGAIIKDGSYFVELNSKNMVIMALFAVIIGLFVAIVKNMKPEIHYEMDRPGIWESMSKKNQLLAKVGMLVVIALIVVSMVFGPSVKAAREKSKKNSFTTKVTAMLEDIKSETETALGNGTSVDSLNSVTVDGVEFIRVYKDQRWTGKSEDGKEHGVYMVDGVGSVVYISYKDKNYCATWSGPSGDEVFLNNNGGWNKGKGYGWSGSALKK